MSIDSENVANSTKYVVEFTITAEVYAEDEVDAVGKARQICSLDDAYVYVNDDWY